MSKAPFYGVHQDDSTGVNWLYQAGSITNLLGLPKDLAPYKTPSRFMRCTHSFQLEDIPVLNPEFQIVVDKIKDHEMFQVMLPTPTDFTRKAVYIEIDSVRDTVAINYLLLMANMTAHCHLPARAARNAYKYIADVLGSSNMSKFMISNCSAEHLPVLDNLIGLSVAAPGQLIMVGERIPTYSYNGVVKFMKMDRKLTAEILSTRGIENFRALGNSLLREHLKRN